MNVIPVNITGPEPIDLPTARPHCYVVGTKWDAKITNLIKSARRTAENQTWLTLRAGTYKMNIDEFPSGEILRISEYPIKSVESITYIDGNGASQTMDAANYYVDNKAITTRIQAPDGWPATKDRISAVSVNFTAGFDDSDERLTMPETLKDAMLFMISHWFFNRMEVMVSEGQSVDAKEIPQMASMIFEQESIRTPV